MCAPAIRTSHDHPDRPCVFCLIQGCQVLAVRGGAQADQAAGELAGRRRQGCAVRDGVWALRIAAYRHVRRGGAHDDGAARLRGADRGSPQDAAAVLLRRHGRDAQDSGERAGSRGAGAVPAQAADGGAQPVWRRLSQLRRPQQRDAAAVPRYLRLRLRIRQRDRVLQGRPLRRGAAARGRALRGHHGRDAADAGRGAAGDVQPVPADFADQRARALCADEGASTPRPVRSRSPTRMAAT